MFRKSIELIIVTCFLSHSISAQNKKLVNEAEQTMLRATKFMVEEVSYNGGYLWYYLPDFSRQWGEMEAYKTMIWLQHPGTVSMGNVFLDAWRTTANKYYKEAAQKAANAIIWGQSDKGGWNYMIDFAGDRSLKQWYATIGKHGWRLEEFQHYYGNSTFDDDVTSDAARFLLRMYLEDLDPKYKPALDKAINFILESQYPLGGWPQRYPLRNEFTNKGNPDYTSFYTFNDDVTWENIHFLIQCYMTLGEERFLDPILRGMNFYIISQDGSGAWGEQLNLSLETVGARTYEPKAFLPGTTFGNARLLLEFYKLTGDKKFLAGVPRAIEWLEQNKLPEDKTEDGRRTHPTFIDPETGEAIYVHRKGSNVDYGYYYVDSVDTNLLSHYYGKTRISLDYLKEEYNRLLTLPVEEVTKNSPLKPGKFKGDGAPQDKLEISESSSRRRRGSNDPKELINSLDNKGRWLDQHAMISNPYIGEGMRKESTDEYATTMVGDETDTSPYRDTTDQKYISTSLYIRNMNALMEYLDSVKNESGK